jgi:phosphoribosylformylglycinamidine synthase
MRGVMLGPFPTALALYGYLFGEDQARYLIETEDPRTVLEAAHTAGVAARVIGVVGGASLTLSGAGAISVEALRATSEGWLPGYMAQD